MDIMAKKTFLIFATIFLFAILLINTVAAFEKVSFDDQIGKYGKISIDERKWYDPFGWIVEEQILETQLEIHTDQCLFNCYSEGTSTIFKEGTLFEKIDFENRKGEKISPEFKIFIKKNVTVEEGYIEKDVKQVREVTVEKWVEYNYEILAAGTYEWRIEKQGYNFEDTDWIATSQGQELRQWAWWEALDGNFDIYNQTGGTYGWVAPAGVVNVSLLVIAGGGGGSSDGSAGGGGGGGAGGVYFNVSYPVTPSTNYSIVVGAGGSYGAQGVSGSNSVFGGTITAIGGGGGGKHNDNSNGLDGGSGGGGGGETGACLGGTGTQPASADGGYGNDGGDGQCGGNRMGGGGGGAGSVGETADGTATGSEGGDPVTIYGQSWAEGGGGTGNSKIGGYDPPNANTGDGGSSGTGAGAYDGADGVIIVRWFQSGLQLTNVYPDNAANLSTSTPTLSTNVTDLAAVGVANVTVNVFNNSGNVYSDINTSGLDGVYNFTTSSLADGNYWWNMTGVDATTHGSYSSDFWNFTIDTTPPVLTSSNLTDVLTFSLPVDSVWTYNASDSHLDLCYYNTTDNAAYTSVTCNSTITTSWAVGGSKTIQFCANDTLGFETCDTTSITVTVVNYTQTDNPDPVGEGGTVHYEFNVSQTGGIGTTTATLHLNGTLYDADTITSNATHYFFGVDVIIPSGWGNTTGNDVDWYWNYTISGVTTNSSTTTQTTTIYEVAIDDCGTYGDQILNMTLKDEETNTVIIPPTINGSTIEIDLQLSSIDDSSEVWTYANTWEEDADGSVQVCVPTGLLSSTEYRIDFTVGYDADNYAREFFYLDNGTLDSTEIFDDLTNQSITLYDLVLDDSTTFLFEFYDEDNLEVPNSIVHTFRKYIGDGVFREVERSKEDDNGQTHIHLVEEDVIYYFVVSLNGQVLYTSSQYNAKCLATPCQIELEASSEFQEFDTDFDISNGTYEVSASATTRVVSLAYAFPTPTTINMTILKYSNDPDTLEIIGSDQDFGTGGTLTVTVPQVAGNVTFIAAVYEDGEFIDSEWVNFNESGRDYFGNTGVFMALLLLLCLILMAASEGEGTIIFTIIGLIVISVLKLIDLDYYALVGFICAGVIIVWKISVRRRGG